MRRLDRSQRLVRGQQQRFPRRIGARGRHRARSPGLFVAQPFLPVVGKPAIGGPAGDVGDFVAQFAVLAPDRSQLDFALAQPPDQPDCRNHGSNQQQGDYHLCNSGCELDTNHRHLAPSRFPPSDFVAAGR